MEGHGGYASEGTARMLEEGRRLGRGCDLQKRLQQYRVAFADIDVNGDGKLDIWEIRRVFQSVGIVPKEDDLYALAQAADTSGDGAIDFDEFVAVLESSGRREVQLGDELETLEAFTALGGNSDKTGSIDTQKVKQVIGEFGLTIEIEELLSFLDSDASGLIDFEEFRRLFVEGGGAGGAGAGAGEEERTRSEEEGGEEGGGGGEDGLCMPPL